MAIEIERKFLVSGEDWRKQVSSILSMQQGYLSKDSQSSIRIRIVADQDAWITIKSAHSGISRKEFEYAIPVDDASELLELCQGAIIEKKRHIVRVADAVWEVDEFSGANSGLVVAEIELDSEDQAIVKPAWLGEEVTGDRRYLNSQLVSLPFRDWPENK